MHRDAMPQDSRLLGSRAEGHQGEDGGKQQIS
jgi:hypothetical protein